MHAVRTPGIDPTASIGDRSRVNRLARVGEFARVGTGCDIRAGAVIGRNVLIGRNCVVREGARLQESVLVEDAVTIEAEAVLASRVGDHLAGVTVRSGAVIGAGARCVGPAVIGRWAVVEPGAVVVSDVPDFAVVAGSPAARVAWVGRAGVRLAALADGAFVCPQTGERYLERDGRLALQEDAGRG
ncbi:acyltransferase [Gryllotalpicola kribbensis]|uniref:Acyltransferase n=1 Tax=Gryllotalpicola kribbensis TaxID=993084 RepID=A0ABP8AW15_9MICO